MPCNWKFPSENFTGDAYHNISHRSVDMVGIGPSGQGRRDTTERATAHRINTAFPELGHAAVCHYQSPDASYTPAYQNNPAVEDYFRQAFEERKRRLGENARLLGLVSNVFPNISYLARQPRSIAVWHPRGPDKTEAWRWFLVDKDAPEEVKDVLRLYYIRYSGPAGMTEQDDMENWNYAHSASRGIIARRHHCNYAMGLGFGSSGFSDGGVELPGQVLDTTDARAGEQNQRAFYSRWSALMEDTPVSPGPATRNGNSP